jgi:hypothetical protein
METDSKIGFTLISDAVSTELAALNEIGHDQVWQGRSYFRYYSGIRSIN